MIFFELSKIVFSGFPIAALLHQLIFPVTKAFFEKAMEFDRS